MLQQTKTAEQQISRLILKLKDEKNLLSVNELIIVLESLSGICRNQTFINTVIQSVKILLHNELKHRTKFTKRENEIIVFIGQGIKNSEIATALTISKSTVETHRKNIRKKLKLKSNDNLQIFALIFSLQYKNNLDNNLY
jgi:DNA-binding NarL/FixJ family response regulator